MLSSFDISVTVVAVISALFSATVAFAAFRMGRRVDHELEESQYLLRRILQSSTAESEGVISYSSNEKSQPEDLQDRLLEQLTSVEEKNSMLLQEREYLRSRLEILTAEIESKRRLSSRESSLTNQNRQVIRDINHSLKTPLSQLDTIASLLEIGIFTHDQASKDIKSAVRICYYYLNAFRSLSFETVPGSSSGDQSFEKAISDAIELYTSNSNKSLGIFLDIPDDVTSTPTYYAAATLMPLIENAVQAAPNGSELIISGSETSKGLSLRISNKYDKKPPANFEEAGISGQKGENNEGLGIAIAHGFLEPLAIGELTFQIDEDRSRITANVLMRSS